MEEVGEGELDMADSMLPTTSLHKQRVVGGRRVSKDHQNAILCLLLAINSPYVIVGMHTANTT
jgi:hypothetical protein